MAIRLTTVLALLLAAAPTLAADRGGYRLDPVHTRVLFSIDHAGFSNALGTVSGSEGKLVYDPERWLGTRLYVTVPLQRIDLGDAGWNAAARDLLGTDQHPQAIFLSDRMLDVDGQQASVCGVLELNGVSQPLCLAVTVNKLDRAPMPPFRRTLGFSATAELSRSRFGIDKWPEMIGDTVTLRIEGEAVRDDDAIGWFEDFDQQVMERWKADPGEGP